MSPFIFIEKEGRTMVYYRTLEYRGNFPKIHAIVKGELFTYKEKVKYNIPDNILEKVNISKKSIYFFFGARFQQGHIIK